MQDGYHNGKGRDQATFERLKQNPLFEPYIAAYTDLMDGSPVDFAKVHLRLSVNSQLHMNDHVYGDGALNWVSYRAAGENAMGNILTKFIAIERGWLL